MKVIFAASPVNSEESLDSLQRSFPSITVIDGGNPEVMSEHIGDAEVYVGAMSRENYVRARKLKWIQSVTSGINDFLAIPEFMASDVLLTTASGAHAVGVAESTIGMILAWTRGLIEGHVKMKDGVWARPIRERGVVLKGSTLGIVGLGSIGQALIPLARGFQMRVIAVTASGKTTQSVDEVWGLSRLDDLLRESDYVVVTVPFTRETQNMIGAREIGLMKKSAMLVAISRGGIVNEPALAAALRTRKLAAAAMDVFEVEPLPEDSELRDLDNLILEPHISGGSQYEAEVILEIISENLGKFLRGEHPLRNQVDKSRQY